MTKVQGKRNQPLFQTHILHFVFIPSWHSIDGDSDSLSEFRDLSPIKSPLIDEQSINASIKTNGYVKPSSQNKNQSVNKFLDKPGENSGESIKQTTVLNGGHASPLRSQLELNLKKNPMPSTVVPNTPNLLQVSGFLLFQKGLNLHVFHSHMHSAHFVHILHETQAF